MMQSAPVTELLKLVAHSSTAASYRPSDMQIEGEQDDASEVRGDVELFRDSDHVDTAVNDDASEGSVHSVFSEDEDVLLLEEEPDLRGIEVACDGLAERAVDECSGLAGAGSETHQEDDVVCKKCGWGDDNEGNEILLCDGPGCTAAFHQRCLPVTLLEVPDGDWLCPRCSKEEVGHGRELRTRPQRQGLRMSSMAYAEACGASIASDEDSSESESIGGQERVEGEEDDGEVYFEGDDVPAMKRKSKQSSGNKRTRGGRIRKQAIVNSIQRAVKAARRLRSRQRMSYGLDEEGHENSFGKMTVKRDLIFIKKHIFGHVGLGFDVTRLAHVLEAARIAKQSLTPANLRRCISLDDKLQEEGWRCFNEAYAKDSLMMGKTGFDEIMAPRVSDIHVAMRMHFKPSTTTTGRRWTRYGGKGNQKVR